MRYKVKWRYASAYGGPWQPGDEVVLDEDVDVDLIQRDSGGVLEPITEQREQPPAQNRQLKRKATRQDRGNAEPITKADFRAVKDE